MKIEVIRLLVRELWFFVCFLYLDNYVVTCFFDFEFSFDNYETRDSGLKEYDDSKRVYGRNAYDHYFARDLSSKKLKNALYEFSYNHKFPYEFMIYVRLTFQFIIIFNFFFVLVGV
jgi:hypothetical protein